MVVSNAPVLVTGATGNIGRKLVDHLLRAGAGPIRALTANPARAALPSEVEVVQGYLGALDSLSGVFDGVRSMYLAPVPETTAQVMELAADAGVQHVVDLAGPEGSWWYAVEQAVEASGVLWTHLEPGEFMDNYLMWAEQISLTGQVRDAYPDAASAPIHMDDVAAAAAVALLEPGHQGQAYLITGPEMLTRAEMAGRIGQALGQPVPYVEVSHEEAVAALAPSMGEYAQWYVDNVSELMDGPQPTTDVLERLLGRPATTFLQWAQANRAEFARSA